MPQINENPLTRAATQLSQDIVQPLRNILVGRKFASINPYMKGDGKTSLEVTSISDLSDGFIQYELPTGNEHSDSLISTTSIVKVPVLFKKFEIPRRDVLSWNSQYAGIGESNSLNAIAANTAARKVSEQEEELIFNGWKPDGASYTIKGFSQIAGNTVTGGSIATAGTLYEFVADAMGKIEQDRVFAENNSWNLALTLRIHAALMTKRFANGDRENAAIKELLGDGGIYVTPTLVDMGGAAGTDAAILTPVDTARQHFEFLNPVDYRIELAESKWANLSPVEGIAYELFAPHYNRLNSNNLCDAVAIIDGLTI